MAYVIAYLVIGFLYSVFVASLCKNDFDKLDKCQDAVLLIQALVWPVAIIMALYFMVKSLGNKK